MGLSLIRAQNKKELIPLSNKYASWSQVQHFMDLINISFRIPITNFNTVSAVHDARIQFI